METECPISGSTDKFSLHAQCAIVSFDLVGLYRSLCSGLTVDEWGNIYAEIPHLEYK